MNFLSRFLFVSCVLPAGLSSAESRLSFNRDIRPILSDRCYHCHGPDGSNRKADLRLDVRGEEALLVLAPGEIEASEVVKRIFSADAEEVMPPPESHKTLTADEKAKLRRWIAEGAVYEPHWAYAPLVRPVVPGQTGEHPIDAFVREKLPPGAGGFAPEASQERLLRRVSLDLTGLPPTESEREAFLADRTPGAYERQVDRLLASPRFGERMAVWWLDIARFTDTVGFHGDQNQRIFPYRDYVIAAFNSNKPFDVFTTEQLAGDLLPSPTVEQRVATGYNRLNMMTREGGAQPKEYLAKYGAERVRSVAAAWLGSTFGCAECHDHKFDPIATRDFYELQAFFADVRQWGVYHDYTYTPNPELRGFSNDHPFPPELQVESPYLQAKDRRAREALVRYLQETVPAKGPAAKARASWLKDAEAWVKEHHGLWTPAPAEAQRFKRGQTEATGGLTAAPGGGLELGVKARSGDEVKVTLKPAAGRYASLRVQIDAVAFPLEDVEGSGLRLYALIHRKGGKDRKVEVQFAEAKHKRPRYRNGAETDGVAEGWRLPAENPAEPISAVWVFTETIDFREGDELGLRLSYDVTGTVRFSLSPFAALDPRTLDGPEAVAALTAAPASRSREQSLLVSELWLGSGAADPNALATARRLAAEVRAAQGGRAWTLVTEPAPPIPVRVLPRGNWQDESGPLVLPATPSFLPGRRVSTPESRLTRLDLARWLTSAENPITARTVANRLWQPFFGTALSAVVDDLGSQGELPSHPDLLDWLACEFRESGWDVKHLIRLIVTSRTYRQSTVMRPELRDLDPGNRLLAAQTPRRLEAEFVRDNALFVAGLLNLEAIGGPSVRPYQPEGHYAALQFPDRDYVDSGAEEQWRRGVYMHWQRTFLHPMLVNFDAPNRDECTAQRTLSNTPQQALTLLNDPTFVEAARVFAARLLTGPQTTDAARLDRGFVLAVGHAPKPADRGRLLALLASQLQHYTGNPEESRRLLAVGLQPAPAGVAPATLAAWTQVCRVLLNAQETITRY
ncbi:MAG: PSD1 and planctomycete cytochrome C domain-containing protein [Opitutaceae bacterium]